MLDKQLELEKSIENNLYSLFAKDFEHARDMEIFISLAYSIREKIGKKWFETLKGNSDGRMLYILSFEYTFGDQLITNLMKLDLLKETKNILKKYNIDFADIKNQDIEFPLSFSDLGEVSSELLELFSSLNKNVYSYGLRYRRGMLKQKIVNGEQVEKPDDWKVNKNPWEHEKGFSHIVNLNALDVKAIPYDLPIVSKDGNHVNTLRLWKSFSVKNIDFNIFSKGDILKSYNDINRANSIVEFLYPNENNIQGRKLRFIQEYFFASACIQDILKKYKKYTDNDIKKFHEKVQIQLNDVHPIFAIIIFIKLVMRKYKVDFEFALEEAKKTFLFLHLSLLPESFEKWDLSLINEVAPELLDVINSLDIHIKDKLTSKNENYAESLQIIKNGSVDTVNIAYFVCKNILTLTKDYSDLIKNKYMINQYDYYHDKIKRINLQFDIQQYLSEINIEESRTYEHDKTNTVDSILQNKIKNKLALLDYLELDKNIINERAPFIMHLGVFHEYKRQMLSILGIAYQYYRLKVNPNLDIPERVYFYAGKSYPNYYVAKECIKFINALAKQINNDLFIKNKIKIVFIENFDTRKSNMILPACDINQKLDLTSMQENKIFLLKSLLCSSNVVSTKSSYNSDLSEKDIDFYLFGSNRESIMKDNDEYKMYEFLQKNQEIKYMFDFYRNLPKQSFSYDINNIYNALYYFNDEYKIFKDLFEYVETMEKAIKDYTNEIKWGEMTIKNIETILKEKEYQCLHDYMNDLGGVK